MDQELEVWSTDVMAKQKFRNGIFVNWMELFLQGIRDYRSRMNDRTAVEIMSGVDY